MDNALEKLKAIAAKQDARKTMKVEQLEKLLSVSDIAFKIQIAIVIFIGWFFISILASDAKVKKESCGKNYPIDYFFFTNLFCEIKETK